MRLSAFALTAALVASSAVAQPVGWSQFQGDAGHTGRVAQSTDPATLTPAWSVTPAAVGMANFYPGAVSDGGSVFASGTVSFGSGIINCRAVALSRATGTTAWTFDRSSRTSDAMSVPSVADGRVYLQVAGTPIGGTPQTPEYPPFMYGLSAGTGTVQFATPYLSQGGHNTQPTVYGGHVYALSGYYWDQTSYDGTTGTVAWASRLGGWITEVPAAAGDRLYTGGGGTLTVGNRLTGELVTTVSGGPNNGPISNNLMNNVALGGQNDALAYVRQSTSVNALVSYGLGRNAMNWRINIGGTGPMAVADGKVYVPAGNRLRIVNEATGTVEADWQLASGVNLTGNALVTDDLAFVASDTATYAFDRQSGALVWTAPVGGLLSWADHMLVVSGTNRIAAFAVAPVPEPGTLALLAAAAAGGWAVRRRRAGTPPPA